jgi:hypothetical protein
VSRPALEVADIFHSHGPTLRQGHVSLGQLKVMSVSENCRTASFGGHVARCKDCAYTSIAYNSCRNRHCPKCQGAAAKQWLADREVELQPTPYFHVVFTLPARIADIAYHNWAGLYYLLFKVSAETMLTIAADPKHLGARIGITSVLHTWGSAMTHHPHVHMIVPGGGISADGQRWVSCRSGFADWKGRIAGAMLNALAKCCGVTGPSATALANKLRDTVDIPWDAALEVFSEHDIPRYLEMLFRACPGQSRQHSVDSEKR